MNPGLRICLLGAESTGKTTLTASLAGALRAQGHSVAVIPEVLRAWCEREGRTPRMDEQQAIADEQMRRVDAAQADVVISDTGPLMVAVYSDMLFGDRSLYEDALAQQRRFDITLLTGLDIPWVADGLQRDGPHVRAPVDALVRAALERGGVAYRVVYGEGDARLQAALRAVDARQHKQDAAGAAPWVWQCDKCSDPACEHRMFTRLAGT